MTQRVAVIDYGMGNLHSVASALEHAGALEVTVTHDHAAISKADRVVFPGVGGIRDCMDAISGLGCDQLLEQAITVERKPVLAICVGMQSLMTTSEENGGVVCLNQVPGEVTFREAEPASLDELERRLSDNEFDLVAVGRALISNPSWVDMVRDDRPDDIKPFRKEHLGQLV